MRKNENDMIGEPYLTEKKDEELKNNPTIKFGKDGEDGSIDYQELSSMFPANKFVNTHLLVVWDDVLQYTSLGLMEVLNVLYKLEVVINPEHFFTRPNEYCNGMDYVYKLFSHHLTKTQIDGVKKKYYWKLLQISMKSLVFQSIQNTFTHYTSITYVFPFDFPELPILIQSLKEAYKNNTKLKISHVLESEKSISEHIKEIKPNAIIAGDIDMVYLTILENDLKRVSIIGPIDHNNLNDESLKHLKRFGKGPLPNYCSLDLYEEQVVLPNFK